MTPCPKRLTRRPFWLLITGLQLVGFTLDPQHAQQWVNAGADRTAWLITHHQTLRHE